MTNTQDELVEASSSGVRHAEQELNTVVCAEALDYLRTLPDGCVNCCVTSPPYYGLRDYGTGSWVGGDPACDHAPRAQVASSKTSTNGGALRDKPSNTCRCGARRIDGQIGLENSPDEYLDKLVVVFREVRRVLRSDGVAFVNMGDSYAGSGKGGNPDDSEWAGFVGNTQREQSAKPNGKNVPNGFKPKDLMMMPARLAIALQADGWYLRSEVVWSKPNPMPESVCDRPTKAHEMVYLLTKSPRYFYDAEAIREPLAENTLADGRNGTGRHTQGDNGSKYLDENSPDWPSWYRAKTFVNPMSGRNKRSVWTVPTESTPFAHFATFPRKLIEPMILAGCPERCCSVCGAPWVRVVEASGGTIGQSWHNHSADLEQGMSQPKPIWNKYSSNGSYHRRDLGFHPTCSCTDAPTIAGVVLDPFMGSGTVALVARALGRHYLGCDLNPDYVNIARERLRLPFEEHHIKMTTRLDDLPLFRELDLNKRGRE